MPYLNVVTRYAAAATLALTATATTGFAADCAMNERVYEMKRTDTSFNLCMPPTKRFNIGMPPMKRFNLGMPPTDAFIMWDSVVSAADAKPIETKNGAFILVDALREGDELKGGDIAVFKGSYKCNG